MATNTLILTGLERSDFGLKSAESSSPNTPTNVDRLHNLITKHVPIVHWAPLKSFGRVLAVFQSSQDAVTARHTLATSGDAVVNMPCGETCTSPSNETSPAPHTHIKSYFYSHTSLYTSEGERVNHLHPPAAQHLFFISPPPSPPVGWNSKVEDPPRVNTPPVGQHHFFSDSDTESVNGLELESEAFTSTLEAALLNLERIKQGSVKDDVEMADNVHSNNIEEEQQPAPVVTTQKNAQGKLTRRMTLHESSPTTIPSVPAMNAQATSASSTQNKQPSLSLKTDAQTLVSNGNALSSPTLVTPTIILEWEEDEDEDTSCNTSTAFQSTLKNVKTERPPMTAPIY